MAQWNGQSMVLPDENAAAVYKTETADQKASLGRLYEPVGLDAIPLVYGDTYEFRVRLMDLTSGGPLASDRLDNERPPHTKSILFLRHVIPEPVRIPNLPKVPDQPVDALFADNTIEVGRPLLGYPSVVFTGKYADPIPLLQAAATLPSARIASASRTPTSSACRLTSKSGRFAWTTCARYRSASRMCICIGLIAIFPPTSTIRA